MIKKILIFLALFYCLESWGATWYVRPAADCANNGDGTSYGCAASNGAAGAWRIFSNVVWGVSGVNTGDTLRACGSFVAADFDGGGLAMLSVDQSGVTVDGDCSASGGAAQATFTGDGLRDYGLYCHDNATCPNQTWQNIRLTNFELRGFYVRNGGVSTNSLTFFGQYLYCDTILGGANAHCFAGFGSNATLENVTSTNTSDDSINWAGDNFSVDYWRAIYPGYLADGANLGDCVQVVTTADNARIKHGYCDKTNNAGKHGIIVGDPATGNSAEISDNIVLLPTTGNATNLTRSIYSVVPNTKILRNYVVGGYYGIYLNGASMTVAGNVVRGTELRGIDAVSTVSSGTHLIANNTLSEATTGIVLNGGASVTNNVYNNLVVNSTTGYNKGGSSTLVQDYNAGFNNGTDSNGAGVIDFTANPLFAGGPAPTTAGGFKLLPNSPLRRAGLDLNLGNTQDNGNRAFSHPPSIGAWEAASGDLAEERTTRD